MRTRIADIDTHTHVYLTSALPNLKCEPLRLLRQPYGRPSPRRHPVCGQGAA
jgi:predicted TIM-barrel fold metal-dependent hydrolase